MLHANSYGTSLLGFPVFHNQGSVAASRHPTPDIPGVSLPFVPDCRSMYKVNYYFQIIFIYFLISMDSAQAFRDTELANKWECLFLLLFLLVLFFSSQFYYYYQFLIIIVIMLFTSYLVLFFLFFFLLLSLSLSLSLFFFFFFSLFLSLPFQNKYEQCKEVYCLLTTTISETVAGWKPLSHDRKERVRNGNIKTN